MTNLTNRQKFILGLIQKSISSTGKAPSIREIQKEIGCASPMGVVSHLKSLERKGFIKRIEGQRRGIVLRSRNGEMQSELIQVPLVGDVACGMPIWAEELIQDLIPISSKLIKGPKEEIFMLNAKGDSMNLAGIDDGDYIIFRKQNNAENGDKVVVLIGTEATVKRIKISKDHVEFHPMSSNKSHKVLMPEAGTFMIQGKVIGVVKNY